MEKNKSLLKEGAVLQESWVKDGILYEIYANPDKSITTIDRPVPADYTKPEKTLILDKEPQEHKQPEKEPSLPVDPSMDDIIDGFSIALAAIIVELREIKEIMKLIKIKL